MTLISGELVGGREGHHFLMNYSLKLVFDEFPISHIYFSFELPRSIWYSHTHYMYVWLDSIFVYCFCLIDTAIERAVAICAKDPELSYKNEQSHGASVTHQDNYSSLEDSQTPSLDAKKLKPHQIVRSDD